MENILQRIVKMDVAGERLLRHLLSSTDLWFVINVTKDHIVYTSVNALDKLEMFSDSLSDIKLAGSVFSEIVNEVAQSLVIQKPELFTEFFDTEALKAQFEQGNTKLQRVFQMSRHLKRPGPVEHHLMLFKDDQTDEILAVMYILDRFHAEEKIKPDSITGGYTRTGFISAAEEFRNSHDMSDYAVLSVNIRAFSTINEVFGIAGGNELLHYVYQRISESPLNPVFGAREEADRFLFFVRKSNLDVEILPHLFNFHWNTGVRDVFVRCICGIFNVEDPDMPIIKVIDRARIAKDYISNKDIDTYCVFNQSMFSEYSKQILALSQFDRVIQNKEFVVFYQPIVDAKTEKTVYAEALIRKKEPDGSILMPDQFVPILEKFGYITKLDWFVAEEVASFLHRRFDNGLSFVPISINISQRDLLDADTMNLLIKRIKAGRLPRNSLALEITETTYAIQEKEQADFLNRLRESGVELVLDDFGVGYSSFGMFQNYFFKKVKLDICFIRQLTVNPNVYKVVEAIIMMCHNLGVCVVAEGVETEEEVKLLRELNCDYLQGYYYSRPLCEKDFIKYVEGSV